MRTVGNNVHLQVREQFRTAGMRCFIPTVNLERKRRDGSTYVVEQPYVGGLFFGYGTIPQLQEQVELSGNRLQWVFVRGRAWHEHMIVPTPEMENFMAGIASRNFHYISVSDVPHNVGKRVRIVCRDYPDFEGILLPSRRREKSILLQLGDLIAVEVKVVPDVIQVLPPAPKPEEDGPHPASP